MPSSFPGFAPEALQFLRALKKNNHRDWFQPRKERFEELVRNPMLALLARVNADLAKHAPDYISEPAKAIFRIYRDTRFSNDKTPYKTHVAAVFSHRGMPRNYGAGFYFQVSAEKTGIGGGIYMPPPDVLRGLRTHVANKYEKYAAAIRKVESKKIAGKFENSPMTRVPKPWTADDPAADLLRSKSLFFYAELPAEAMLKPTFEKEVTSRFRAISPFVQLLDEPLLGEKKFSLGEI